MISITTALVLDIPVVYSLGYLYINKYGIEVN